MECPNCHEEMEPGYLEADSILWTKSAHRFSLKQRRDDFPVAACGRVLPPRFNAYICKKCSYIIFNYAKTVPLTGAVF